MLIANATRTMKHVDRLESFESAEVTCVGDNSEHYTNNGPI